MTISLQAIPTTRARLSALPLARPMPRTPHLIAPERARRGDFIGVFGGVCYRPDFGLKEATHIEVAFKKGVLKPENLFIDEMSAADAKVFRKITAVPFGGFDHHRIVRQANMVEKTQPYQIHLVQFADAILYAHPDWLQGVWGKKPAHTESRPLMMMLKGARSPEEAKRCLERTKRYMRLFCSALPPVRSPLNLYLEMPNVDDFLAAGGDDHAFVRW